jgi:hypothetical protein
VWSTRNVTLARRLSFHFDPRATRMRWIPTTNHNVNDSIIIGAGAPRPHGVNVVAACRGVIGFRQVAAE